MEIPEEGRDGTEAIFPAIITEKFLKLMADTKSQIQKTQGTQSRKNVKQNYT